MKISSKIVALLILLISCSTGKAQNHQPKASFFSNLDNVLPCKVTELEKNFSLATGKEIKLALGKNLILKGYIYSSLQRYHNLKSAVVKLSDFNGAILSISRRVNDDNTITYAGRIVSEKSADGFELKTDIAGNYFLSKIKMEDLVQDHE